MKTLEIIKREFKSATGWEMPVYTYRGSLGVLYDNGMTEFIQMEDFLKLAEIDFDSVRWAEGADGSEEGEEITDAPIVCPENEQKLMVDCVWSSVLYNDSDQYVRELLVTTDQYYNWTSNRRCMIDALEQDLDKYGERFAVAADENRSEELKGNLKRRLISRHKDWDKTCSEYSDPLSWSDFNNNTSDFSSVLNEMLDGYDYDGTHEAIDVAVDYLTSIKQ